ncbi:unnamed protein product [Vicia faba]|uniref:Uncharacterized protein n=1 Tax=Vicia faba TaxID=3906 RepID=A0AAV0YKQ6_VICFA|nr:unnamed protein product [Vicia faba]
MDSQNFDLLPLVSLFLFILVALNIARNLKKKTSSPNLLPGPWKLLIIGHLGEIFAVVVSSPEYAKEKNMHNGAFNAKASRIGIRHQHHSTCGAFAIITKAALGKNCKVQEELACLGNGESVAGGFDIGELFPSAKWLQVVSGLRPKLERLHRQIDELLVKVIIEHKEAKLKENQGQCGEVEEDLVDVLLNFQCGNDSLKKGSRGYIE